MIKSTNLSIGNIVSDNNNFPMVVEAIFKDEVYLNFKGNEGDIWETNCKDLYPIIIDKLLLKKLGFKETKLHFNSFFLNGMQINFINDKFIDYVTRVELQGLHHLQNIYYYKTGKELNVKKLNIV